MAQGRMLKRKITKSKKIAALKSDKARLLWFYLLPFTDAEGRIEADVEDIREDILRKQRKGFSLQRIKECLDDLHRVGLIILYSVNGKDYLEYTRFLDEQNIRKDKEAESEIPAPNMEQVQDKDGSGTALPTLSLSKDKIKLSKKKYAVASSCDFANYWNSKPNLSHIQRMTNERKKKLTARMKERIFVEHWQEVIDRISASAFCTGGGEKGWKASVDWLLSNSTNYVKVMEGKYDDVKHKETYTEQVARLEAEGKL